MVGDGCVGTGCGAEPAVPLSRVCGVEGVCVGLITEEDVDVDIVDDEEMSRRGGGGG